MFKRLFLLNSLFLLVVLSNLSLGQTKKDTSVFEKSVIQLVNNARLQSDSTYKERIKEQNLRKLKAHLDISVQDAQTVMQTGIDTTLLKAGIIKVNSYLSLVSSGLYLQKDGLHLKSGSIQTQRNLTVSSNILNEMLVNLTKAKSDLDLYSNNVYKAQKTIDSLGAQSVLYDVRPDSAGVKSFITYIRSFASQTAITDKLEHVATALPAIQQSLNLLLYNTQNRLDKLKAYRQTTSSFSLRRDLSNIWETDTSSKSLSEVIKISSSKIRLAFRFYVQDNFNMIAIAIFVSFIIVILLKTLKSEAYPNHIDKKDLNKLIVLHHPIFVGIFLCANIFQLIFPEPPFLFSAIIWLISLVMQSLFLYRHLSTFWMKYWLVTASLFVISMLLNLLLEPTIVERWIMIGLSIAGIIHGTYTIRHAPKEELRIKEMMHIATFLATSCTISLLLNIFGRYDLSKTVLSIGLIGAFVAIGFLWTIRLLKEIREISTIIYRDSHNKDFKIRPEKLERKILWYINLGLVLCWLIVVGRNFYIFTEWASPFEDFLEKTRTLGEYSYSIKGLVLFILIMSGSLMLSKITSYFASESGSVHISTSKKSKIAEFGSWILLLRIFIICAGVFIACAAAGIPLDKLGLIIGALGVGIGLGLQGLVNNLVSGLIIAFEKPVNVGDLIEVNDKMATMKSIGFRSSVVVMNDGASVIIPNGDLLSERVINWTMGRSVRRLSILIGVAYGSDLSQVKELLLNIVSEDDSRILSNPEPIVLIKEFNSSSIDFELLFWAANVREAGSLRSDIITKIDSVFTKAGISIPFPQQDVYIKSIADKQDLKEAQKTQKARKSDNFKQKEQHKKNVIHQTNSSNSKSIQENEEQIPDNNADQPMNKQSITLHDKTNVDSEEQANPQDMLPSETTPKKRRIVIKKNKAD